MNLLGPLIFALIAAVGNGLFALGQRKSAALNSPFTFIIISLLICILMCLIAAPWLGSTNYSATLKGNSLWLAVSGVGLFLTYIGFNLLYSNYGASGYVLYAVLSILTTSVVVGAFILKENINIYHWLGVLSAIVTVILFSWGNHAGQA